MATSSVPVLAGITSTTIFAASTLPMLAKAWRTRDLASYSRGNIVLSNIGNTVHSVYVFSLPAGPIWLLHTFYLATSALMLIWSVRYAARPEPGSRINPSLPHRRRGGQRDRRVVDQVVLFHPSHHVRDHISGDVLRNHHEAAAARRCKSGPMALVAFGGRAYVHPREVSDGACAPPNDHPTPARDEQHS